MKISDEEDKKYEEELKKYHEQYELRNKLSFKIKEFYSIYLSGFTRYLKNRGGWLFLHFVLTIIFLITRDVYLLFVSYTWGVILYEFYVYSLREKLDMNKR